jgi:hypothetical protein
MRKGKGDGWQDEYACRRLLGAVLLEAVLDVLSEKGVRWQDRTSAMAFLRDANVQALCEAHLALPPDLWRAFAEAVDRGVEIDYAVVEGLGSGRRASSPCKCRPAGESRGQAGATPAVTVVVERTAPEPAAQPALPGGLIGLMRRVQQAVGRPAAAGAG